MSRRRSAAILAIAVLLPALLGAEPQPPNAALAPLSWLVGCWESRQADLLVVEEWKAPSSGVMLGASRTIQDGRAIEWESMQIQEKDGALVFTARPSGQAEASFVAIEVGSSQVIFENKGHDFPQRVIYRLAEDGSLAARIEGSENGAPRAVDFPMTRATCPETAPAPEGPAPEGQAPQGPTREGSAPAPAPGAGVPGIAMGVPAASQDPAQVKALLEKGIEAAGGAKNIERYPAFDWRGQGIVHAGGRDIVIEGRWQIVPPDRARVETEEPQKEGAKPSRLMLDSGQGWTLRAGQLQVMSPLALSHERDQFYLYSVMRLVPLRAQDYTLTLLEPGAAGETGLRASRSGRRDVDLYFEASGRLTRLVTRLTNPLTSREVVQEVRFTGVVEDRGVRWPQRIAITWNGQPYFDLQIVKFALRKQLEPALFRPAGV